MLKALQRRDVLQKILKLNEREQPSMPHDGKDAVLPIRQYRGKGHDKGYPPSKAFRMVYGLCGSLLYWQGELYRQKEEGMRFPPPLAAGLRPKECLVFKVRRSRRTSHRRDSRRRPSRSSISSFSLSSSSHDGKCKTKPKYLNCIISRRGGGSFGCCSF